LNFLQKDVDGDYELLIQTATNYESDSALITSMASEIQNTSAAIEEIIMQITQGIGTVSLNAVETASKSKYIQKNVDEVTDQIGTIVKAISEQTILAEELKAVINVYNI
jgi:methyl-accepting chemotaxis protein